MSDAGGIPISGARGRGILIATVLASGMVFLDTTVVNVALPTLASSLGADVTELQWIVDAYLLTLSALLLTGGALGDRFGRRRVLLIGLVMFTAASVACGLAPTPGFLIGARTLQGLGGALLVPGSLAILRAVIRDDDRGRAIGLWSGWSAITTALGPVLAGWLIGVASWRWAFWINVPLAVVALFFLLRCVPENRNEQAGRLDVAGAVLATLGLGGVVYALIEGPAQGLTRAVVALGAVGLLALAAFLVVEARARDPMVPLSMFRSRQFSGANVTTLAVYFGLGGSMFFLMLQLQRVLGYSPLEAGAAFVPFTVVLATLSPVAGEWTKRVGHRLPMTLGPMLAGAGIALFVRVTAGASYLTAVLPGVLVFALGMALTVAPLTDSVFQAAPRELAGVASGVNNAVARVAGLLAVALLPWFAGLSHAQSLDAEALSRGFVTAILVSAATCVAGGVIAFFTIERAPTGA